MTMTVARSSRRPFWIAGETFTATSAETAIAEVTSVRPHVIVCDIGMPDTDGYMFMRQLRALPEDAGGRTAAIAVTGFARSEDVR